MSGPAKRPRRDPSPERPTDGITVAEAESVAARLLRQMGYQAGQGLGRHGTGRTAPVSTTDAQVSRHGLGFHGVVKSRYGEHQYVAAEVQVELRPEWLVSTEDQPPPDLTPVAATYQRQNTHADYGHVHLQEALFAAKSRLDAIDKPTFLAARDRANPFAALKREYFQNRAALKMAEIDAICDRMFTRPASRRDNELLYFADICAGPGGFTEFLLTVHQWRAMGFGFTLRGPLDFRSDRFNVNAPAHSFRAYYGVDQTGDITQTANMQAFANETWRETDGRGLHVVMADGGFSVRGQENYQEQLSQQLLLCQITVALATLHQGGHFVCKTFDTFLPLTVHLLYVLRCHFEAICILKPCQSRPANSERFVVCRGMRQARSPVVAQLYEVNQRMQAGDHVVSLFPDTVPDAAFVAYMRIMNDRLTQRSLDALTRTMTYMEDANLRTDNQAAIRTRCLEFWGIGSYVRYDPQFGQHLFAADPRERWGSTEGKTLFCTMIYQEGQKRQRGYPPPDESKTGTWLCTHAPATAVRAYLCVSRAHVFRVCPRTGAGTAWLHHNLPADTALDVLLVHHEAWVLDAWALPGDREFFRRPHAERLAQLQMFVRALRQPRLRLAVWHPFDRSTCSTAPSLHVDRAGPKPTPSYYWVNSDK